MPMSDPLGDRMKQQYENRTRFMLPRRTYTIMRLDGRAFHTELKYADKPYDTLVAGAMDTVAQELCAGVSGAVFAYTQSDEISLLLQDFENIGTQPWFDGNVQKMASVSAATASAAWNVEYPHSIATFDSRVFTIPDPVEVANYFIWRQRDCQRNAVLMVAQTLWGPKEIEGMNVGQLKHAFTMREEDPFVFEERYEPGFTMGRIIMKETYVVDSASSYVPGQSERTRWVVHPAPLFTCEPGGWLSTLIPKMPSLEMP